MCDVGRNNSALMKYMEALEALINPFALRAAKIGLTIFLIFYSQKQVLEKY